MCVCMYGTYDHVMCPPLHVHVYVLHVRPTSKVIRLITQGRPLLLGIIYKLLVSTAKIVDHVRFDY